MVCDCFPHHLQRDASECPDSLSIYLVHANLVLSASDNEVNNQSPLSDVINTHFEGFWVTRNNHGGFGHHRRSIPCMMGQDRDATC